MWILVGIQGFQTVQSEGPAFWSRDLGSAFRSRFKLDSKLEYEPGTIYAGFPPSSLGLSALGLEDTHIPTFSVVLGVQIC